MPPSVLVSTDVAISTAVNDCVPAVFSVALKVCFRVGAVNVIGRQVAFESLLVKCSAPV